MILHSIKWRLQLWYGFLLTCLICSVLVGFYVYERRASIQAIDSELTDAATGLLPRYAPPTRGWRPPPPDEFEGRPRWREGFPDGPHFDEGPAFRALPSEAIYYVAWSEQGRVIASSSNAPPNLVKPENASSARTFRTRDDFRELVHGVPAGRALLLGTSLVPTRRHLEKLALTLAAVGVVIVGLGLGGGYWIASRALRPVAEISQAAREIASGDLSRRINPSETESELGQLAGVLNSTFARLEAAFHQQQQFTSDAAHELRTPVSVILTQIQSTLNKDRSALEYKETLEACQRAAQRMRRLIESLLQLARFDAGQETLRRDPVDLAKLAGSCLDLVQPLAQEKGITLGSELHAAPVLVLGDPDRLSQVITNLLTNAILHGRPKGQVRLRATRETGSALLCVTDNGAGIAAEHLPHIFERFYRADASRNGATGGSGLGLAISKAIAEAHGGTIEATSDAASGTTFCLRLPSDEGR